MTDRDAIFADAEGLTWADAREWGYIIPPEVIEQMHADGVLVPVEPEPPSAT